MMEGKGSPYYGIPNMSVELQHNCLSIWSHITEEKYN